MADLTKIIDIKINLGSGKVTIDGLTSSIKNLDNASSNLSKTLVGSVQPAYKRTEQAIRDQISYQRQLQKSVEITSFEYVQHQRTLEGLQKELSTFQGKNAAVAGGLNGMRNSAGLASQTLVEVGRTISDANYGFTAVANNLSQLGYYFVTLVDQSKGFGGAIKSLGKQMLGAGGLIIAFQLVIFLIEKYTLSQREAKRETEKLNDALSGAKGQIAQLQKYGQILDDSTASIKSQQYALSQLKKEGYDKTIGSIADFLKMKQAVLLFDVKEEAIREKIKKQLEEQAELETELLEVKANANKRYTDILGKTSITQATKSADLLIAQQKFAKQEAELNDQIQVREKRINSLLSNSISGVENIARKEKDNPWFCLLLGNCKEEASGSGKGSGRRDKLFEENLLNLDKIRERFRQKALRDERTTAEELIAVEKRANISRLQIDYETYLQREKSRYEEYTKIRKEVLKNDKSTKAQKEQAQRELVDAEKTYNKEREEALKTFGLVVREINKAEKNEFEILERQKSIIFQNLLNERQAAELASVVTLATNDLNRIDAGFNLEKEKTAQKIALIEEEKKIRQKAGQDTFIQDQQIANETEALNQKRLQAFEQGEQAKLAIANQVGEAIIAIAGEGSAVGKAVAVAMATMNTYEAVTAALGAKPYGPWNIAQAAATAAMGFVQVRNILKTEVPSPKGGAGGGAAAAPSIQPPDFNIVGQSASNQLASAVQGQFSQPVKAYVVSKDVSTAQEMDRNIVGTASLG